MLVEICVQRPLRICSQTDSRWKPTPRPKYWAGVLLTVTEPSGSKGSTVGRIVGASQIVCGAALAIAAAINIPAAGFEPMVLIVLLITAIFFVGAFFSWRGKGWAYIIGIVASVVVLLIFGSPTEVLYNPAGQEFAIAYTFYVAALVAIVYGVYGLTIGRRSTSMPTQISRTTVSALVAVGVVVGGLLVGTFAGQTQRSLLGGGAKSGDITIVLGAGSLTTGAFSPGTFTVKVGTTVTWYNADASTHTVTSTTAGTFDSGLLATGGTYSHAFTAAGTYDYYCTIHPNMKGTIVVTA